MRNDRDYDVVICAHEASAILTPVASSRTAAATMADSTKAGCAPAHAVHARHNKRSSRAAALLRARCMPSLSQPAIMCRGNDIMAVQAAAARCAGARKMCLQRLSRTEQCQLVHHYRLRMDSHASRRH